MMIFLTSMLLSFWAWSYLSLYAQTKGVFLVQGGKIRSKLVEALHNTEGVIVEEGSAGESGKAAAQNGMRR